MIPRFATASQVITRSVEGQLRSKPACRLRLLKHSYKIPLLPSIRLLHFSPIPKLPKFTLRSSTSINSTNSSNLTQIHSNHNGRNSPERCQLYVIVLQSIARYPCSNALLIPSLDVGDKVNELTSGASKEANKNVAKDSNASLGTRAEAAKDAAGDKIDETKSSVSTSKI